MENILSGFLDGILGAGETGSKSNRKYVCPFHISNPPGKRKLEIDINTDEEGHNKWHCWGCNAAGKTIRSLLWRMGVKKEIIDSLKSIIVHSDTNTDDLRPFSGILPSEYVFLPEAKEMAILAKHARIYLKKRGITIDDIYRYQIGYCDDGEYAERVIFPSFDNNGKINFFIGRSIFPELHPKYKYPAISRDIIPFELFINWNAPIILCEGVMDMAAIKRNCIPLLGKTITPKLKKKLIESKVRKIYIAMDSDAVDMALQHCEEFLAYGKKVFLIDLPGNKDPNEMGFKAFTEHVQIAKPLTLNKIMQLKLKL